MLRGYFSKTLCLLAFSTTFVGTPAVAQEVHQDFHELVKAEVIEVVREDRREIEGTSATTLEQEVRVEIKEGERVGEVATLINEVVRLKEGDSIFVNRMVAIDGQETITYADFERRPILGALALLFVVALLFFSRWQGVRALASLALSVCAILFVLVPALLAGYDATLTSVGISAVILALALFGTHGINPRSVIAFGGTYGAVVITGLIAYPSVHLMRLTGFGDDAAVYLNFATNGQLDLTGLLLGAIIIGILGALDDVSITQVSVVEELKAANKNFGFNELYARASIVGRNHIGSMVNTLALAYVAVSLPLILLYAKTENSWVDILNHEVVASEMLRIIIGSLGLILAVPATTAAAAWHYRNRSVDRKDNHGHGHHHHH
ncbi:MAG: YibE/F family protein [Candidatus Pacebacteria bacterium]|nr:YibE/F family protein [Candidatus Paceibacterota bacterium]